MWHKVSMCHTFVAQSVAHFPYKNLIFYRVLITNIFVRINQEIRYLSKARPGPHQTQIRNNILKYTFEVFRDILDNNNNNTFIYNYYSFQSTTMSVSSYELDAVLDRTEFSIFSSPFVVIWYSNQRSSDSLERTGGRFENTITIFGLLKLRI